MATDYKVDFLQGKTTIAVILKGQHGKDWGARVSICCSEHSPPPPFPPAKSEVHIREKNPKQFHYSQVLVCFLSKCRTTYGDALKYCSLDFVLPTSKLLKANLWPPL